MLALLHRSPFTRKLNAVKLIGRSSGLVVSEHLPVGVHAPQWYEDSDLVSSLLIGYETPIRTDRSLPYSYGDSAGFAPDFPFNGAMRQPNQVANVAKNKLKI